MLTPTPTRLKIFLPLLVLLLGIGATAGLLKAPVGVAALTETPQLPEVSVLTLWPQTLALTVQSQGVVAARDEIDLVAEVSGKVIAISPKLVNGGVFEAQEVLLTLDTRDYEYAITSAEAQLAAAKRQLLAEQAQVEQAHNEWQALGAGEATPLALHKPQLAEAQAKLAAAIAGVAKAKLHRDRCTLRAPFAGRVRSKTVGLGQYIQPGVVLAKIYASDVAEIRLPVSTEQLGYLNLSWAQDGVSAHTGPQVRLTALLGGRQQQWDAHIVRSEAALDSANAQLYLIAEVAQPYQARPPKLPLLNGLWVQAEIVGQARQDVFVLPRTAVNAMQEVWLVDAGQRLILRAVQVLSYQADSLLVQGGLQAGERVVLSALTVPVAGTQVRVKDDN